MRANPPLSVLARHLLRAAITKGALMSRRSLLLPVVLVAAASLLACSSSSSKGSAPTIKDFVLTPTDLTVGKTTELNGTMTIEDVDGDIAGASGIVIQPGGQQLAI